MPPHGRPAHHHDDAQNRRVQRLVQARHAIVGPVNRQAVLNQIVGANGEEIHLFGEQVRRVGRCRDLDHGADRDGRHGLALSGELGVHLGHQTARLPDLLDTGDKGEKDPERAVAGGPEEGADLRPEQIRAREAQTQPAQSLAIGAWPVLGVPAAVGSTAALLGQLLLVDIEGADGHRAGRHALEHPAVDLILRLFISHRAARSGAEQELGTIETDPLGASVPRRGEIARELDVRVEPDPDAIGCRRRRVLRYVQAAAGRPPVLGAASRPNEKLRARVHHHFARSAVDDHQGACRNPVAGVVQANHNRHFKRAREDGGVVRAAAGIGGKPADLRPIHLSRQRRRQLVGDQHRGLLHVLQEVARCRHVVPEVHAQAAHQIRDVSFTLAEIRVRHLVEHGAELLENLVERPLGVDALLANELGGAGHQHRIVEHQQLRVEQGGQLGAPAPQQPRSDVDQLLAGARAAGVEPRQLLRDARGGQLIPEHAGPEPEDDGAPGHDAWRHANARQTLHGSSPNPDSTSAASASTAPSASAPSAVMVIVEPRDAARSRSPMMLLPSTSRPWRDTRTSASNLVAR